MLLGLKQGSAVRERYAIAALPFQPQSQPILPQPSPISKNWNHAIIRGSLHVTYFPTTIASSSPGSC